MAPLLPIRLASGLFLSSLVGLLALPNSVFGQFSGDGTLHKLEDPTGMAKCLDGSPMAYYHRAGNGTGEMKWLLSYEGGGWSSSLEDCALRTLGPLGSSSDYKSTTPLLLGKLTNDPKRNPTFHNWNIVYVKYCSGDFFSGDVLEPSTYMGQTLYFRGAYIHRVLVEDLMYRMGMVAATDVVVSGCSAGAVQTLINTDKIRSLLPARMRVTGLPDSGFLVPYEADGACKYQESMANAFSLMNVSSSMPRGCLDKLAPTGDQWRCMFFAQHLVPFIKTPMFIVQSKYDYWQMDSNIYCKMLNVEASRAFGRYFEDVFAATFKSLPRSGYLLDSCTHHCGGWDFIKSDDGLAQHEAFDKWYTAVFDDPNFTQVKHQHTQAGLYPCLSCCVQGIFGSAHKEQEIAPPSLTSPNPQSRERRLLSLDDGSASIVEARGRMLNEDEFQRIKETMEMLGEVGPSTSSSDSDTTTTVGKQSFEIAGVDESSSTRAALEEEKEGGNEEEEGGFRSLLRRLAE